MGVFLANLFLAVLAAVNVRYGNYGTATFIAIMTLLPTIK